MIKRLLITALLFVELLALKQWLVCKQFKDFIHFSATNKALYIDGLVNNDGGMALPIVRFFHNKIVVFTDLFLKYYLRFWDDRFAINIFSVVGYFGIILGLWYLISINSIRKTYKWIILAYLLAAPLVEIILEPKINFVLKLILLTLPFQALSVFGIWQFVGKDKSYFRLIFVLCIMYISILWISVLQPDVFSFCVR